MLINALRFRDLGGPWQAFRFGPGTGRFRNYLCATGDVAELRRAAAAVELALTGRVSPLVAEVEMIVSDDAGLAWTIKREPGRTLILRDNQLVENARAERELLIALLDVEDAPRFELGAYKIAAEADGLKLARVESGDPASETLRVVAERQVKEFAIGVARILELPELANPAVLAKLGRALEPLYAAYRELVAQYHDLKTPPGGKETEGEEARTGEADVSALSAELDLIRQIGETAQPLLAPGASMKVWRDELGQAEAKIAEIVVKHQLGDPAEARCPEDLRKPMEALARLDAYARLVRASQGARKQCETEIEPLVKEYLALGEQCVGQDQKIVGELESCLEALSLKLAAARGEPRPQVIRDESASGLKTWFDRFRSRQQEEAASGDGPAVLEDIDGAAAELETARMTVEFARERLEELGRGLGAARPKFTSVLRRFDDTHDELVRAHAKLKEHWTKIAAETGLPETMTITELVALLTDHANLAAMMRRRLELAEKIRDAAARLAKLGRLVPEWRRLAKSQKAVDLSSPQMLLTEARDVVRYKEAKEKRLAQLILRNAETNAEDRLKAMLRARRKELNVAWRSAFEAQGVNAVDLSHEGWPEAFRRASLVRALGLVIGTGAKGGETKPFDAGEGKHAASVFLIEESRTSNPARLLVLEALENATGDDLRVLLVADEGLAAMLGSLGVGQGAKVATPEMPLTPALAAAQARATMSAPALRTPPPPRQAAPSPDSAPRARTPTVAAPPQRRPSPHQPPAPLLSDRARQALDLLNGKK